MNQMPMYRFHEVEQKWVQLTEDECHMPNPDYVDCDPNELWIDLITGEVKETPIR